jgi:murein L,D-transpeptidase YafK
MRFLIVLSFFILTIPGLNGAMALDKPDHFHSYQESPVAMVLVEKSKRLMTLLDRNGYEVKRYRISLGNNPVGTKIQNGDGRTPEGRYIIDARNDNSAYHLSLRISYPNEADKRRAKKLGVDPGSDIFIHGLPNGKSWQWWKYNTDRDWTQGCIAVTNADIEELWHMIPDGTPIVIQP